MSLLFQNLWFWRAELDFIGKVFRVVSKCCSKVPLRGEVCSGASNGTFAHRWRPTRDTRRGLGSLGRQLSGDTPLLSSDAELGGRADSGQGSLDTQLLPLQAFSCLCHSIPPRALGPTPGPRPGALTVSSLNPLLGTGVRWAWLQEVPFPSP